MRWLIKSSISFRFLAIVIAAALIIAGGIRLRQTPVDVLPEFSPPYVEIQTESLGLSAEEVEQLITVPMEQDLLNGVPWLDTIRSESAPGVSSIVLVFKPGTDLMRARQMVSERMTQAVALPHVSKPPTMLQPHSSTGRVLIVRLSSKSLSLIQMGVLARWTVVPRLMGVPGVASVAVWGQRDRQLQVLVDPNRLKDQKVSLLDVLETTGNALWVSSLSFVEASTPGTGGFIDMPNQRLSIRHISPIVTADGLAEVPISDRLKNDGSPLRLGDVANVVENNQPLIGDAIVNDGSGLLLVVEKFPGSNTLEVTRGLENVLAEMQPGLTDVTVDTNLYRPATFIETALGNLTWAFLLGAFLIALALGAFYWNWRMLLISIVVIPLSLVAAILAVSLSGATLNTMVLAGLLLAVGVVVDDTVIDIENVMRRLREKRLAQSDQPLGAIVLEALGEMRSTILFATLILLIAVVPIFAIEGQSGALFQPMVISYSLAVIASMLAALVVTPGLCMILLAKTPLERGDSPLLRWLQRGYQAALTWFIHRSRLALVAAALLTIASLVILPVLKTSLLPTFKERDVLIHLGGLPGTSDQEMNRISNRISDELRTIPGVRDVGALIGRAVLGDQVVDVNSAELWASIDPSANYDKTLAAIRQTVNGYPGLSHSVQTYLQEASRSLAPQAGNSISVRIYGDVDEVLHSQAVNVQKAIQGINGISATHIVLPVQKLTVETEVDINKAQRYGLKPGDVRRAAATLLSGIQVGSLFEQQKVFDVVVWSTPETRSNLSAVRGLLIDTPDGGHVRLGDVADVRIIPTASVIRHESVKRYVDVIVGVQGRSLTAVAADINHRLQQMQFPLEYHAELLGDYAVQRAAEIRLTGFCIAALIAIFFLLQAAFNSWRLAALGLFALPAALSGGILAVFALGGNLSIASLVGLLAIFGIALRNILLLIDHYQKLQQNGGNYLAPVWCCAGPVNGLRRSL